MTDAGRPGGAVPALRMEGITKSFAGVRVLSDVTLTLEKGEVHGLLGENGAGKSTLLKILTGAYHRDSGTIAVDGTTVDINTPARARDLGIALIHQELSLLPHLTIAENIFLGRMPRRRGMPWLVDWATCDRRSRELLAPLGLDVDPRSLTSRLKVAEQQLVEIAKALSTDVSIVAMDEPTASLTETEIERLFALIAILKARGASIIYVSHRLNEVGQVCDRATVLRDGRFVGTVDGRTTSSHELARMMVGRELDRMYPKTPATPGPETLRVTNLNTPRLHDIDFRAHSGEILGIAGLVGSGRTELARALFGADPITSGSVEVEGKQVNLKSPRSAIAHGVGLLPEDRKGEGAVLSMSIAHNVTMASLGDVSRAGQLNLTREREAAQKYITQLGIVCQSSAQEARSLSGGNQQKVVLAKWLCSKSRILIVDEPTRGVDVGAKAAIHSLLNDLAVGGATIVMISSELPEVMGMSDRMIVMHEGRISGELHRDEFTEEAIMLLAAGLHETEAATSASPIEGASS